RQLLFADSNLINGNRLLNNIRELHAHGMAMGTDVERIELQQSQLQARRVQLKGAHHQALNSLKFHMGMHPDTPLVLPSITHEIVDAHYPVNMSIDARIAQTRERLLLNELEQLKRSRRPTLS